MINLLVYITPKKMHNETRTGLWKYVRKSIPAITIHNPGFKSFLDDSGYLGNFSHAICGISAYLQRRNSCLRDASFYIRFHCNSSCTS